MVAWFEIPVIDMDRAIAFYEKVFNISLQRQQMGIEEMAFFPFDGEKKGAISGALIKNEKFYKPSDNKGVMIYFESLEGDLAKELSRVEAAGGKVLQEKKLINEQVGCMGLFLDTEGNRMAMYHNITK
ncbi:VOC family protein [Pseudofulvibacter geojedonensis]|uniref:VOC family protein n=1 Tax=Pseudofulvibacter geojedonensis TaxID=1123758 RepID=A0ABW3HZE6_9FLAO